MNAAPQYAKQDMPVHKLSGEGIQAAFEQEARFYRSEEKPEEAMPLPRPVRKPDIPKPEEKKEPEIQAEQEPEPVSFPLPVVEEEQDKIWFKGEPVKPDPEPEDDFPQEEPELDFQIAGDQEEENDPEDEFPEEPEERCV